MSPRALRRLLLIVVGATVVMDLASLGLALRARASGVEAYDYIIEAAIGGVFFVVVTIILVVRRSDHPITWLFVASATAGSLQQLFGGYAAQALSTGSNLVGGRAALAVSGIFQTWWVLLFLLLIALFPTGKPLSGWLGRVVWLFPVVMLLAVYEALTNPLEQGSVIHPPLVEAIPLGFLTITLSAVLVSGAVAHVIVRYVRSTGIERQQLKWFVFAFVVGVIVISLPWSEDDTIGAVLWTLVPTSIIASVAVAILRYRLYDIDKIISRTVSYSMVIGILGLLVLGLVTAATAFLPSDDPLVVAMTTLAVAAVFNPLRLRVQRLVERRFNRSRYNAESVMEDFAGSLRERVDHERVVDGWLGVVQETMQPAAVGVWVKE